MSSRRRGPRSDTGSIMKDATAEGSVGSRPPYVHLVGGSAGSPAGREEPRRRRSAARHILPWRKKSPVEKLRKMEMPEGEEEEGVPGEPVGTGIQFQEEGARTTDFVHHPCHQRQAE